MNKSLIKHDHPKYNYVGLGIHSMSSFRSYSIEPSNNIFHTHNALENFSRRVSSPAQSTEGHSQERDGNGAATTYASR